MFLHFNIGSHVVHRRVLLGLGQGRMLLFEDGGLMGKLMWGKGWCMLSLHGKGVLGRKVMGAESMRIKAMELSGRHCLSRVQSTL